MQKNNMYILIHFFSFFLMVIGASTNDRTPRHCQKLFRLATKLSLREFSSSNVKLSTSLKVKSGLTLFLVGRYQHPFYSLPSFRSLFPNYSRRIFGRTTRQTGCPPGREKLCLHSPACERTSSG